MGSPSPGPALSRFAVVMAAGIISTGLDRAGYQLGSLVFLGVGAAAFAELLASEGWKLARGPASYRRALTEIRTALGLLTFGVGSVVLAARLASTSLWGVALALLGMGLLVCLGGALAVGALVAGRWRSEPWLDLGGGLWMLWPVALEAASVGVSAIATASRVSYAWLSALSLGFWGLGVVLYLPLAAALILRLRRRPPLASVGPSYWIVMGAAALAALGARLLVTDRGTAVLFGGGQFALVRVSFALFALATLLVPLPLGVTIARTRNRQGLAGAPKEYWAAVFPCGMYALTSMTLAGGSVGWLGPVGVAAVWVAVAAFVADLTRSVWAVLVPG